MLLRDFALSLRAEGKAASTIKVYTNAAVWLAQTQNIVLWTDGVTKSQVRNHIAMIMETRSPAYANQNFRSLQAWFRWLESEEGISNPMRGLKAPRIPPKLVPVVPDGDYKKLLATCSRKNFTDIRDKAILEMFRSTGARLAEVTNLNVTDIDLDDLYAIVTGKGSRMRVVRFDASTAVALSKYLRQRKNHKYADQERLWLGERGPLGGNAIHHMIERRCQKAGVKHIHAHLFRHTFSHKWLLNDGQEVDLMAQAGWSSREMLSRYGASAASVRAREHYDKVFQK